MEKNYDFSGWATKHDMKCSDGRTIMRDAFKECDGKKVPLVWNHNYSQVQCVLGHALLKNLNEGVYAYCSFNDTESGKDAKLVVEHGDIVALSIYANHLEEDRGGIVRHGVIREVSLVHAGANPGASIDSIIVHSDGSVEDRRDQGIIYTGENFMLAHSDDSNIQVAGKEGGDAGNGGTDGKDGDSGNGATDDKAGANGTDNKAGDGNNGNSGDETKYGAVDGKSDDAGTGGTDGDAVKNGDAKAGSDSGKNGDAGKGGTDGGDSGKNGGAKAGDNAANADAGDAGNGSDGGNLAHSDSKSGEGETIQDIVDSMSEKQQNAVFAIVASLTDEKNKKKENKEDPNMSHNIFEQDKKNPETFLTHADGMKIVELAKSNGGNSLRAAIELYCSENKKELKHADDDLGFKDIDTLFPEYELVKKGAPEKIQEDWGWVGGVLSKVSKSPKNRLRVRFTDKRDFEDRRARGYKKGTRKEFMGNLKLLGRTVDPTTVYNLDHLNRDDVQDITDFDLINYMYLDQNENLRYEIARQILIGDGRNGETGGDEDTSKKIDDTKIIPIWGDDELFAIHVTVDFEAMRNELQGTDTAKHFGDGYVFSEAIIQSLLFAREDYKGSGNPDFYCTPRLRNQMLLARDFNGRRLYDNKADLTAALDVNELITVEMLKDKTRKVVVNGVEETHRLLGILVNLKDYRTGMVKGGEITHFSDFDIHFNQHESLLETRLCGMLDRPFSAIILEEKVNP